MIFLCLVVVVAAVVIVKFCCRRDQTIPQANGNVVPIANGNIVVFNGNDMEFDVEDGKHKVENDWRDDGYVGGNDLQKSDWMITTSC